MSRESDVLTTRPLSHQVCQSSVSMVRDLWWKGLTKKVSFVDKHKYIDRDKDGQIDLERITQNNGCLSLTCLLYTSDAADE